MSKPFSWAGCRRAARAAAPMVLVFVAAIPLAAQDGPSSRGVREPVSSDGLWTALATPPAVAPTRVPGAMPGRRFGALFALHQGRLRQILQPRPSERPYPGTGEAGVMTVPLPDGRFTRVRVEEAPILSPELSRRYPSIRTYRGQGVDDPTLSARLDQTPWGFHAQLLTAKGSVYVDPVDPARPRQYRSYWKRELVRSPFRCGVEGGVAHEWAPMALAVTNPSGDQLRTYRLAVTATGEYTEFFAASDCPMGSPAACPHDAAVARITTTMNRVTGIYEREVAVRFDLVAFNVYTDHTTDPFPNGANVDGTLLDENQTDLDAKVGSANYDIGHIVSQGGAGGLAGVGVTCGGSKARGGTSRGNPAGDDFDVDYVAHEMGHQMGGKHTFNGTTGSCAGGNRSAADAYEPGSGTTIMAYAGICGVQDVQPHSDDYFHVHSFDQITDYRDGGGAACGTLTATGNTAPSVDAGPDYTIPQSTPFTLTAVAASDADGDAVTYDWEEFDLGAAGVPAPGNADGPLFRSRPATSSPSRTLPRLQDLLSGAATPWEVLPGVNRDLNFRVTVRDNRAGGGGVDYDSMVVHVSGSPFEITSPLSGGALECGAPGSLTWDKGGSTAADVSALLSTDGGSSFSALIPSTPNDGSESFTVPTTLTSAGWLKLEPTDNIYFSLSGPISIQDTTAPTVTAPLSLPAVECTSSAPQGASPALGAASASDLCDASVPVTNDAPGIFPLGTTTVTWSGTDDSGNTGTATQTVTVVDTTPPSLVAPPPVVAECTSPLGTPVALGTPTVSDVCWASVPVANNAPALFPLGTTTVTWTATDGSGNGSSATQAVTVQDTTPPVLHVTVAPAVLWPPNHKMVTINAQIDVADVCDGAPTVRLVSITSNEPDNGLGDGDTANDIQGAVFGTDDRQFQLRAERSGKGTGRVYTIVYEADDGSGNQALQTVLVTVPHNQ
jgi:hypothetical protein